MIEQDVLDREVHANGERRRGEERADRSTPEVALDDLPEVRQRGDAHDLVALAPELIAHGVLCAWQPDRVVEAVRDRLAEAAASHSRSARERA